MGHRSSDRELEMQSKLICVENDQIRDNEDTQDYSFTLSGFPSQEEPATAMMSSRSEEDQTISFSFSTQLGQYPSTGRGVSSPKHPGQLLWGVGQLSTSCRHDDDLQIKHVSAGATAASASREHARVLFQAAPPYDQQLVAPRASEPADYDNDVDDKGTRSLASSTSLPAMRRSVDEQGRRSSSTSSQSSCLLGASDRHSEKTSCSSRSSSGNSEDTHFNRKDPPRFRKEPSYCEPGTIKQVSNSPSQHQLRKGKPNQSRDATVAHNQETLPPPLKSSSNRRSRSSASLLAQPQPASKSQKNDSSTSAQGMTSESSSAGSPSLSWKLLSLQPLNPSHKRPDHDMQELRARRLSRSLRERSSKSEGSSYNQGRFIWSLPSTAVHSRPQSGRSSPKRQVTASARGLEEKPGQGSQKLCKNGSESYWRRSIKLLRSFLGFQDCKSEDEVVNAIDKIPLQHQNSGYTWTDHRRLPELCLFSPNKEARKVAINGAIAHCKSTHQKGFSPLRSQPTP